MWSMRSVTLTRTERHRAAFSGSGCDRLQRAVLRAGVWEPRWEKGAERIHKSQVKVKNPEKDPLCPGQEVAVSDQGNGPGSRTPFV
ncbi:hypothetical protein chiPu_0028760 [Chiloscyllium punctatum]|uniref:Uncharacterized protein n=1 Tax=Chiloscyllium punctatum TaxID=137246 RepID=A0A401TP04_CHIPU|nr:hypothetical protein [Chiloscyllium punctatum]